MLWRNGCLTNALFLILPFSRTYFLSLSLIHSQIFAKASIQTKEGGRKPFKYVAKKDLWTLVNAHMPTAAHALFSPSFLTHPIQSHSLPSLTHAHTHTHTLAHTRTHSLTPTHTHSHTRTIIINIMSCSKTSKPKEDKEREGRPEWKSNQQIFRLQRHFLQFFSFFLSSLIVMTSSRAAAYLSARNRQGVAKFCPKFGRTWRAHQTFQLLGGSIAQR